MVAAATDVVSLPLRPNLDDVRRTLQLLVEPGEVFEIRRFVEDRNYETIESGYFNAIDAAIDAVSRCSGTSIATYITLNPVDPDLLARAANRLKPQKKKGNTTGDQHITRRTRLLIDVDSKRVSGISATDTEHDAAIDLAHEIAFDLAKLGWCSPLVGDSGNGAHLDYAIDLPVDDDGLVERVLDGMQARYGRVVGGVDLKIDPINKNPARITKLYGTVVRKGDSTPDRPHRLSRILTAPEKLEIVPRELLEAIASERPATKSSTKPSKAKSETNTKCADHVRAFLARHSIDASDGERFVHKDGGPGWIWILRECPFNSDHARGEAHVQALDNGPPGFACKHESCSGKGWSEFKSHYEPAEGFTIAITTKQSEVVDKTIDALQSLGGIYQRARRIVHVVRDVSESHGLAYPTGTPVIAGMGRERMRELAGLAATFTTKRKDKTYEVQCPPWIPATIEQRGEWPFPPLDAISDAPVLRPDGTLHDRRGYDAATRTIYDPGTVIYPPIAAKPTQADARRAYDELVEPVCDVSFVAESDRAAWAALVMTLIARSAINGPTPLFLVRAPIRGTGKGLAIDTASVIATGREAPKRAPVTTEDELRKALIAYALESPPSVNFDNIEGALGSATLAMALTAGSLSDRLLGVSESRTVPIRFVMTGTGNNVQLRGDLGRRVMPIDLDPRVEHPEDRTGFRHPHLLAYVRRERPRLVAAALTILRGYHVAGCPAHGKARLGSYEAWDGVVRGAIVWAANVDPFAGIERIRKEGDEDAERLRALLHAWREKFATAPVTVADAIAKAGDSGELHDALAAYCREGRVTSSAVGYLLRRLRGRICDGLLFDREPGRAGVVRWYVGSSNGGDGGNGGDVHATRERDRSQDLRGLEQSPPSQPSPPRMVGLHARDEEGEW